MEDFPVKNRRRARRRADMQRMKNKAKRIARNRGYNEEDCQRWAKFADHLKVCSCWMCANPRKSFKEKTRQEHKADVNFKQQPYDPDSIIEDEIDALISYKLDQYYHGSQIPF